MKNITSFSVVSIVVMVLVIFNVIYLESAQAQVTNTCPTNYVCIPMSALRSVNCPSGYVCTLSNLIPPSGTVGSTGYAGSVDAAVIRGPADWAAFEAQYGTSTNSTGVREVPIGLPGGPKVNAGTSTCRLFISTLTIDSSGIETAALQTKLINIGFDIPAISSGLVKAGYFGGQTVMALKRYQQAYGLPVTGILDSGTRSKINAAPASCTSDKTIVPRIL